MTDRVPEERHQFAVMIGKVLHPFLLPIPTMFVLLEGLPLESTLHWILIVTAVTLLPGMIYAVYLKQRGHLLYIRRTRDPLYLVGFLSALVCVGIVLKFGAPRTLVACVVALASWLPIQWAINHWLTKISAHAVVATGCFMALLVQHKTGSMLIAFGLLVCVIITLWSRVITRNHTISQVILGAVIGALLVFIVFSIVLA